MDIQKDLVLSINEFAYVLDKTKGNISCWVGPVKTSLSTSDALVRFNSRTKSFEECSYSEAISLFTCVPENWYVILKNPIVQDKHPTPGTANSLPESVMVGRKVNIKGPTSFALYPGQMAKVVRGHALRSNQYLLARVYEANSANKDKGEIINSDGKKIETNTNYVNGQIIVIKGTEVSFYIPPTGIEVIPIGEKENNGYVREAITLERLEYCILKDEDGNKRYVHGPEVVFPAPTETFVASSSGGYIFRAIELSKISGIYAKVIAEYKDENETIHPVGEELFITGDDQMIYYPRPEHAIINYDGKIMHHAIAIPEGEGRYIMNRLTGKITTIKGPRMYLPDPRTEVVVKRKLTANQCNLWFPGNDEVLAYNEELNEKAVEKRAQKGTAIDSVAYCASNSFTTTLAALEAKANISRGTSYTKPRTITLDNKYEGVVSIDVWTGYAVNVVSKNGKREVVCGPKTVLLDYDQIIEPLELSTGQPKTTDRLLYTAYLRHENNKISDIVHVTTKDFVAATVKLSYSISFDQKYQNKWFNVENYVKYLCDHMRSLIAREAKKYTIEEFYQNYIDIIHNVAIDANSEKDENSHEGRFFPENGMYIYDCEVSQIQVEADVEKMLDSHRKEMIRMGLELSNAEKRIKVSEELSKANIQEQQLKSDEAQLKLQLQRNEAINKLQLQSEVNRKQEEEKKIAIEAESSISALRDTIKDAELARSQKEFDQKHANETKAAELEMRRNEAITKRVAEIMESISPDLISALTYRSNADLMKNLADNMAPYAIANGESVVDTTTRLLRGTPLEQMVTKLMCLNSNEINKKGEG